MDDGYRLTIEDAPGQKDTEVVNQGLEAYDKATAGDSGNRRLAVFLRDGEGRVAGGLLGDSFWSWLHVHDFWVHEDLRGRGYGVRLMRAAEEEAARRGCLGIYLETTSYQARPFYEKMGFEVFGELKDLAPGHSFYFLRKRLQPGPDGVGA